MRIMDLADSHLCGGRLFLLTFHTFVGMMITQTGKQVKILYEPVAVRHFVGMI